MTDKKTIDAELQNIQSYFEAKANMSIGDGKMKLLSWANVVRDALELLKEQEPKAVRIKKNAYNQKFYYCPRCDMGFEYFFRKPMFCDKCGQAVKWDD